MPTTVMAMRWSPHVFSARLNMRCVLITKSMLGVNVAVGRGVLVGARRVAVGGTGVGVEVGVTVGVEVTVGVGVWVDVKVGVGVCVGRGVLVAVGVGVGARKGSSASSRPLVRPPAPIAEPASPANSRIGSSKMAIRRSLAPRLRARNQALREVAGRVLDDVTSGSSGGAARRSHTRFLAPPGGLEIRDW